MEFGYKNEIDWLEDSKDRRPTSRTRKRGLSLTELKREYKIGQKLTGTVIHHLQHREHSDIVVGLLVSIVENQVKGLIPAKELPAQELLPLLGVGAEVQVEVVSIRKEGLRLRISE